ncbi:9439_t:CDS:2 [Funneliformis geosporum]|nr:9439_t:CDS:2 [Funneliformis geosporum]
MYLLAFKSISPQEVIDEFLCSIKYLAIMIVKIINQAFERKSGEILAITFNKLILSLTKDIAMSIRICDIIIFIKYLPDLKLHFPIIYSKCISVTSLTPNTSIRVKLVGYTCEDHYIQVYSSKENYVIRRDLKISQVFQKIIHYNNKKDQIGRDFINFVVPYSGITKYPPGYIYFNELLRPNNSQFVTLVDQSFCDVSYNSPYKSDELRRIAMLNNPKEDLMLKTDHENLVNRFKDEIKILLNLDKTVKFDEQKSEKWY